MVVIPAIDLIDGQCVRLYQGDYNMQTTYQNDAVDLAMVYQQQGAQCLHLVDLSGARKIQSRQKGLLAKITQSLNIPVQLGGGIRTADDVQYYLDCGVAKIVIGSLAINDPESFKRLVAKFGADRFILALDIKFVGTQPMVQSDAWTKNSNLLLWDVVNQNQQIGIDTILCTDIDCDGTLDGPNFKLYQEATARWPNINWQASGGVRHRNDLLALSKCNVSAVIVGRALYQCNDIGALIEEVPC